MKRDQASSDPLPYTQVDRAAKAKAAVLAGRLGVTPQHALGSLVEWWDLNSAPRDLEALVRKAQPGERLMVVLDAATVRRRFRLASGHDVDPLELADLELVEPLPDGRMRVRGMSRQLDPIVRRVQARDAAVAGGKASAAARKAASGSAQPHSGRRSASAQPNPEAVTEATTEAVAEAPPKREPNTAVSGQRSSTDLSTTAEEIAPPQQPDPPPPSEKPDPSAKRLLITDVDAEAWWAWAQDVRTEALGVVRERPPHPRALSSWWSLALGELHGDVERLRAGWLVYLRDSHWTPKRCPWAGWLAQWERFVPAAPPPPPNEEHREALVEAFGDYEGGLLLRVPEISLRREGEALIVEDPDPYRRARLAELLAPGAAVRVVEPGGGA